MSRLGLRIALVSLVVLFLGYFAVANFIPEETRLESGILPDQGLRLGLDLQGGIHWVLGVKLEVAEQHELGFLRGSLESLAEDEGWSISWSDVEESRLVVDAAEKDDEAIREWARDTGVLDEVEAEAGKLAFTLTSDQVDYVRQRSMDQVLEVLRKRIDDPIRGIPDSSVERQGSDRVAVRIPGGQLDRTAARELLRSTGFLEFKIVRDTAPTRELLEAKYPQGLPEGTRIVFEYEPETQRPLNAFLVPETPDLTGEYLTNARLDFDRLQRPRVAFRFNAQGGEIFQELTSENIGNQLAVVLDDRIYSAPVIRARISMNGVIEGRFTRDEAANLAVVLRAGSLAVPVEIEEERTVGPALGAASISRGVQASVIALVLIIAFAIVYYRTSGVYAAIALAANLLLIIGLMSVPPHATLTLPGIAGIVLTVGMAVDANVIIFERIREELRSGKTPRAAVATGFQKALSTILDANVTTFITALVLHELGSGPIKGFAVTLMIGLVTSVFAALVITRLLYAIHPGQRYVESLSI